MVSPTNDGESLLIDIEDVEREMPGMIQHTVNWFRIYKMPTGKPPNQFAFDAKPKNKVPRKCSYKEHVELQFKDLSLGYIYSIYMTIKSNL